MSPTVTRSELNNAPDIIAETRPVPIRRRQSKNVGSVEASCKGKQPFEAQSMAAVAANRVPGRIAYRCPHCRLWHVGNRNKG